MLARCLGQSVGALSRAGRQRQGVPKNCSRSQKAAQNEAPASEEKLKLTAQATHDLAIIVLDDHGMVVSWNLGASRIFRFEAEEMSDRPLDAIFTAGEVAAGFPSQECDKARRADRAEDERWHARKSGEQVFCSSLLRRIDGPGFSGFAKDRS